MIYNATVTKQGGEMMGKKERKSTKKYPYPRKGMFKYRDPKTGRRKQVYHAKKGDFIIQDGKRKYIGNLKKFVY